VQVTIALGWSAAAVLTIVTGVRQRQPTTWRIGFGLAIVGAAQSYRTIAGVELAEPDLLFGGLALLGFFVVLAGSACRFRGVVTALFSERDRQRTELGEARRHAQLAADLAAERDHELANGLAGLSGIAFLLDQPADTINRPALRSAVLAELSRLHAMLLGPANGSGAPSYDAAAVVTELAALRRVAGTDIEVETDGDLRVAGERDALAQALTNLLANCERHAPGSPVRIWARRRDLDVVVDVRDEGPGIPRGTEKTVLERGVTVGAAGGTGLGLDVSARLLDEQGGSLRILPRRPDQPGFSARLALPTPDRATSGMLGRDHPTS
jgi:two-component system OmpR family sensor kinase